MFVVGLDGEAELLLAEGETELRIPPGQRHAQDFGLHPMVDARLDGLA